MYKIHRISKAFVVAALTKVCFRYYHGTSGALRASSPTVTVINNDLSQAGRVRSIYLFFLFVYTLYKITITGKNNFNIFSYLKLKRTLKITDSCFKLF